MHTQTDSNKNGGVDYDFFGFDVSYRMNLPVGEGNVHFLVQTTSSDFEDRDDADGQVSVDGASLSVDQVLADGFTVFVRAGATQDHAVGLVRQNYSGLELSRP